MEVNTRFNVLFEIKNVPYGLKYVPSFENEEYNNIDFIPEIFPIINVGKGNGNGQFSFDNQKILLDELNRFNRDICILEIGVAHDKFYSNSSTHVLIDNKSENSHYFGVDINCDKKVEYETYQSNVHILGYDSRDHNLVMDKIKEYGFEKIDFIFIDGNHSINMMVNDWKYVEYLNEDGVVLFHDTNSHPGPFYVYECIDETLFEKNKYFSDLNTDLGIAVARKKYE